MKNRFSRWRSWRPSRIFYQNGFNYFYLQVTPMRPTKFQVNWPFGSGEEAKYILLRWWPRWPSLVSDHKLSSFFRSTNHPDAPYQGSSQLAFQLRRRREKQIFKMATMAAILDVRPEKMLATFNQQVIPKLSTKFQVSLPRGSWILDLRFSIGSIKTIFDLQVTAMLPTQLQSIGL